MKLLCPSRTLRHSPVSRSHFRRVLSDHPDRANLPSWLKATDQTVPACPLRTSRHWPVSISHFRRVLSADPERANLPSLLTATERIASACPRLIARGTLGSGAANSVIVEAVRPRHRGCYGSGTSRRQRFRPWRSGYSTALAVIDHPLYQVNRPRGVASCLRYLQLRLLSVDHQRLLHAVGEEFA